jgi:RND family efflux transporter MFP subunit
MRSMSARRAAALAGAVLLMILPGGCKPANRYAAPPPPKVAVARPAARKITRYLEATGSTSAVSSVDLVARVAGFVQEISYKDGATVHKGDTLFTIEPLPYMAKLQQAQAVEAADEAQLRQTDAEYKRQAQLGRSDFSSQSTVEQALAARDTARANLAQAQASTQTAGITYTYTRVTAPMDGVATAHLVSVGELVGAAETTKLATVVQLDPIYVTFNVGEQDVLRIRADLARRGLTAADLHRVPVEIGLQTETGYPHAGVLDYAAPSIDPSTGTLQVRGIFENAARVLLPGYFVRVRVPVQRDVDALLVPGGALGSDQGGRYVLVVEPDNTVQQRHVRIGPAIDDMQVIESGLKPDDRVVVAGVQRAVPGEKVDPQQATAAVQSARQAAR